jgi:hypothetical protein
MYTSKDDALAVVTQWFKSTPVDAETLLEQTAGKKGDDTVYRPYYVTATLLELRWNEFQSVASASGSSVTYGSPGAAKKAFLELQSKMDVLEGVKVPAAFVGGGNVFETVM